MNFQITAAATKLIARGRKTIDFATLSYRTRSTSSATSRPSPTTSSGRRTTHSALLRRAMSVSDWLKNHW